MTRDLPSEGPVRPRVLSVSELTAEIKDVLELAFPVVWVAGEIADLARPQSGHCYLTLKDADAQLPAVLWRTTASRVRFDLRDGLEVICRGHLEVYAPRGRYQLIVEAIQPRGIGALELALRQLHEKLSREGLFDPARKRPLPRFPRRIAVVTSPTGAALRDFLEVLRRRWRGADVLVVPVRVQGEGAAEEIAAAIALVNRLAAPLDCLVVTRGGGSLEDLWAFNEEAVVRAAWQRVRREKDRIESAGARLESLSPLAVLGRGYSLTRRVADGHVVRDGRQLGPGDRISTLFARGQALSRVEQTEGP